ncbi:pogo transposable element with KRAB domain-like protein [Aphelenchoides avenae]|nr:pogo transposable element with KRAB domain-like protein [Aphelenchus avenae]
MAAQKRLVEYSDTDSEAEADAPAAPSKKKRNSYSIEMKIGALDMLRAGRSQRSVANYFRVERDTVRDWKLREASLRAAAKMRKKLPGAGRPSKDIKDSELDNNVHNLSYRQATATCQKTPADYEKDVVGFIRYIEQLREDEQFSHVYAADEAAVWLDMASETCITDKGAQEVAALTTGHDKMRITVMLTARSDGYKYRPFVLLNRQRPIKEIVERFGQKLELCWRKTDWMNDECIQQYLETTFKKNPIVLGWFQLGKISEWISKSESE